MSQPARVGLAGLMVRHAVARLRRTHPDWADAMAREAEIVAAEPDALRWAFGCLVASYRAPAGAARAVYVLALAGSAALLAGYEWNADENPITLLVLGGCTVGLGALRPERWLLTGLVTGSVVAAVLAFEAVSGLHPGYETHGGLWHSARWLLLVVPALLAAACGGYTRRMLHAVRLLG